MEKLSARKVPGGPGSPLSRAAVFLADRLRGYIPALSALALGILVHYACIPLFGPNFAGIFFIYLMAMLIAAWCGYGPGLVVVLIVATGLPFLFKPGFSLDQVNLGGVFVLALVSLIVSRTAVNRRSAERVLREMNESLDRRVREQTGALEEANARLQHQLAELETLYGKVAVGLCFLDPELRYVRINEVLAAMNGAPVSAHLGRSLRDMVPGAIADIVEPLFRGVLHDRTAVLDFDVRAPLTGNPGAESEWSIGCSPVVAEHGKMLGIQVVIQDITARKQNETALKEAIANLRRVNGDLEQFAYSASHDLQEPLRMVAIYSQMLQKKFGGKLGAAGDQYLGYTIEGATRMERLVKDLLAYTEASSGVRDRAPVIDANRALDQALMKLEPAIREAGAIVERSELPHLGVHPSHLEHLFYNLISNAIKYRKGSNPEIKITVQRKDDEHVFCVSDNGIGIDPAYRTHIFGLFKRLHAAAEYSGSGIGLSICQRIVERYGGRIWVDSEVGRGANFYFTLPARSSSEADYRQIAAGQAGNIPTA